MEDQKDDKFDSLTINNNNPKFLPIANISRIMKKALPDKAKIAKQAKQSVQQCVSEFISFITCEACEKCKSQKRKTINGQDILHSIYILGFQQYNQVLKLYQNKYRESLKHQTKESAEQVPIQTKQQ